MARKKAAQEAAMKKAAKQKKILMVLALPMAGALVFAVMTFMNLGKHPSDVPATPAASTTPAGSIPTAGTATAGATASPLTPGVAAVPVMAFHSFSALPQKNPFHDGGPSVGAPSSKSKAKKSKAPKAKKSKGSSGPKQPSVPLTGAVISLNGDKLALSLGATFGKAPGLSGVPLFKLVSVTPKTALVSVVGTKQQFTLHVKQPLTLQQYGGWSYTLVLEPLGSAAPMTVQTTTTTTG